MLQNKVQLIGYLGSDIELKELGDKKVANFTLATNESYKDKTGNRVEKTVWHRCNAWGKNAEILSMYTKKGSKLTLEGSLTYNEYKKTKDNVEFDIKVAEILVNSFLLEPKKEDN